MKVSSMLKLRRCEDGEGVVLKGRDTVGACIQSPARETWRRRVAIAVYAASRNRRLH
jgi:hypothetical protein